MREQKDIAADIVKNLRQLADVVQEFAESFQCKEESTEATSEAPTLEEVRKVLAGISVNGHGADVKAIITKFGATKLSELPPEHYEAVLKEAESIGK